MDVSCPRSYQHPVRKVSGIYKEQRRLAPPEEPVQESLLPANSLHIPVIRVLGHLVGYPMAIGFTSLAALIACSTFGVGSATGAGTGVFLFVIGELAIVAWFIWKAKARAAVRRSIFEEEYPRWQRAYKRWDQLYYCQTCDELFVPNGPLMKEEEMSRFLYAN